MASREEVDAILVGTSWLGAKAAADAKSVDAMVIFIVKLWFGSLVQLLFCDYLLTMFNIVTRSVI